MKGRTLLIGAMLLAAAPLANRLPGSVFAAPVAAGLQAGSATVTRDVIALNADGQPVADLTQDDFEVLVDRRPASVARVARTPAAVTVIMLVDGTASQPLKRYELLASVQAGLIPSLLPGDRARLALLGSPTTFGSWLPADRAAALNAARVFLDRPTLEPSPIWDAVDAAVTRLLESPEPRVLLLMSDGRSTANTIGFDEAARRTVAAGVTISVVSEGGEWLIPQFGDAPDRARSDLSLRALADLTGGMFLEDGTARRTLKPQMNAFAYVRELVNTPSKPAPLVSSLMAALRQRYRITFAAEADGLTHALEMRTKRQDVTIRAPRTFTAK
jgi:hypothetical protein